MIRYALRCEQGHAFEAWFRDSAAYDAQRAAGLVACAVCGVNAVDKALMAPAVATRAATPGAPTTGAATTGTGAPPVAASPPTTHPGAAMVPALSAPPESPAARAMAALRAHVEKTADYVGPRFASEARRIHAEGGAERAVWGEATPAEARALAEDGVPVAPLPWLPKRDD